MSARETAVMSEPLRDDSVVAWMREFAAAVRAEDYARGEALFDDAVLGFGTVAVRAEGLAALVSGQWRHVWGVTRGFDFEWERACGERHGDRAWVAAPWSSTGTPLHGPPYLRRGRATIVLARAAGGAWRAVHTHFSLDPAAPAR